MKIPKLKLTDYHKQRNKEILELIASSPKRKVSWQEAKDQAERIAREAAAENKGKEEKIIDMSRDAEAISVQLIRHNSLFSFLY